MIPATNIARPHFTGHLQHNATIDRPPFYQLFDTVEMKLSRAEQMGDMEANEFYSHLYSGSISILKY